MSHRGSSLRRRQFLPFLLVCLAGGAAALLQATGQGLAIPPTGQLVLIAAVVFCLWGLWRWRRMLPLLPAPPWRAALQAIIRRQQRPDPATRAIRRQLFGIQLRTRFQTPPARPRPIVPPRLTMRRRIRATLTRRSGRSFPRVRLPLPSLDIQFVAVGSTRTIVIDNHQIHTGVATLVSDVLVQLLAAPPLLLALHDQPRQITCQFAAAPLLTTGQQRDVVQALLVHGIVAHWSDITLLTIRRESLSGALPLQSDHPFAQLWVPVVRTGQGTIWWPLARGQHLALAGAMQGTLTGLVQRLTELPVEQRPPLLIHDPDARLRELNDTLAALMAQDNALAQARHAQLTRRFAHERGQQQLFNSATPILLVVTPSATIWPDLHPLLSPESGVQVVLILGDREPIGALRAVCHRLPVVEVPDPRYPPLPDAFRPAGLPTVHVGQAIAWLPGGHMIWRGLPPASDPMPTLATQEEPQP